MIAIIHIAPRLPPAICGLGDYATLVGRKIEELRPGVRCGYVACGYRAAEQPDEGPGQRNATGCSEPARLWLAIIELADELAGGAVDSVSLVVHYSGYGYDPGGAPDWLADALERRPSRFSSARIVTFFHELYATGWPWQRAFWTSPRQRAVARRLARLSDAVITNREASARWLEEVTGRPTGSVPSLPVPSNIGEPEEIPPWEMRSPLAATFGGAHFKRPFLSGRGAKMTVALCRKLEIRTLISIGPPTEPDEATFQKSGIEVIQTGYLAAEDVSAHFRSARIALVDYYPGYFSKSGVLAAAAVHGTPPIFPDDAGASDGLRSGEHLWNQRSALAASREVAFNRLSSIARSARAWYEGHNIERHANLVAHAGCPEIAAVS